MKTPAAYNGHWRYIIFLLLASSEAASLVLSPVEVGELPSLHQNHLYCFVHGQELA